ncbi:uncharacterized protein [Onthophagus taurus]|uniref:uncharacterized protein n=1 Tax=Onthophagus taurus TaxID=166361 RepID=UPI0039BE1E59
MSTNKRFGRHPAIESASEPILTTQPEMKDESNNWRLKVLSKPKTLTPKYEEPPYVFESGVRPEALNCRPKSRDKHISLPVLRKLYENKRTFAGNPNTLKNYAENMDKHIAKAWDSIYNEYKKAKRDKKLKLLTRDRKNVSRIKTGKKGKAWTSRRFRRNAFKNKYYVDTTESYSKIFVKPPKHLVKESALNYVPTERVLKLTVLPPRLAKKESIIDTGAVKPGALLYKATERDLILATPRSIAVSAEPDLKENPFMISPGALKYKPTPRILELAKPRKY